MDNGEEVCKTIIQTLPDIVYKINFEGFFSYINEAVCKLGYTPEELIGKHFSTIICSEDLETIQSSSVLPKLRGKITGEIYGNIQSIIFSALAMKLDYTALWGLTLILSVHRNNSSTT